MNWFAFFSLFSFFLKRMNQECIKIDSSKGERYHDQRTERTCSRSVYVQAERSSSAGCWKSVTIFQPPPLFMHDITCGRKCETNKKQRWCDQVTTYSPSAGGLCLFGKVQPQLTTSHGRTFASCGAVFLCWLKLSTFCCDYTISCNVRGEKCLFARAVSWLCENGWSNDDRASDQRNWSVWGGKDANRM